MSHKLKTVILGGFLFYLEFFKNRGILKVEYVSIKRTIRI